MACEVTVKNNRTAWFKWAIILAVCLLVLAIPQSEQLTVEIKIFLIITVFAILSFAFETLPVTVISLFIPVMFWTFGIGNAQQIFAPWTQTSVWMMLAVLVIGNCLDRTGIIKRLTYCLMIKTGGSLKALIYGMGIIAVGMAYSGMSGLGTLFFILVYSICRSLDIKPGSNTAALLFYSAIIASAGITTMLVYDPMFNTCMVMATQALEGIMDTSIFKVTFWEYALHNLIFLPETFLLLWIGTKILKPDIVFQGKAFFEEEYIKMGKITSLEKKSVFVVLALIALFATQKTTGLDVAQCLMIAVLVCYIPGIAIGNDKVLRETDFSTVFFMAGCMAIGTVANVIGVGAILGQLIMPLVGTSIFGSAVSLYIIGYLLNLLLTPIAASAVLGGPLTLAIYNMGMNPIPAMYALVQGLNNVLFPYEGALYCLAYSFGYMTVKSFAKIFTVKTVVMGVWLLVAAVPWWLFLGLYQLP